MSLGKHTLLSGEPSVKPYLACNSLCSRVLKIGVTLLWLQALLTLLGG